MLKYKITDADGYTRKGQVGAKDWGNNLGKTMEITKTGNTLCSDEVFHFYDHPALAVILNPIHGNYDTQTMRLWEVEAAEIVAHDGCKGGCKKMTFLKEIPIPKITIQQKVEFAIRVSLLVYHEKSYTRWATDWLSGKDRSADSASAAYSAAASVNSASAAYSAAASVDSTRAAYSAATSVDSTRAAYRAARAAYSADRAADSADRVKISRKFIQIIEKIQRKGKK